MKENNVTGSPVYMGLCWGVLGGISLIIFSLLSSKGIIQLIPYPLILVGVIFSIKKFNPPGARFKSFFIADFIAFVVMSIALMIYIINFINPHSGISFLGIVERVGVILLLGGICSLILSLVAKKQI